MVAIRADRGPIAPASPDHEALAALACLLDDQPADTPLVLEVGGETIVLPESARKVLSQAVAVLARDQAVAIVSYQKLLTTQQAADLLNVSRPYLVQLLEDGKIPFTKTGTHRRVHLDDLMVYKKERDAERERALERLVRLSEEFGLYDQDDRFGPPRLPDNRTTEQTNPLNLSEQTQTESAS